MTANRSHSIARALLAAAGLVGLIVIVALLAPRRARVQRISGLTLVAGARPRVARSQVRSAPPAAVTAAPAAQRSLVPAPIRSLVTTAGVLAAGVTIAVVAAGGTYAIWNDTTPVAATTIQAGTTGLSVNNATAFSINLSSNPLLPGRSVVSAAPIALKNTGVTPLNVTAPTISYTAASSALSPFLTVSLRTATGATCAVTALATPLPATIAPISFSVGQTVNVCLEIRLSTNAPASVQGATATFLIDLAATQVRP